jgi:hypothetical protein
MSGTGAMAGNPGDGGDICREDCETFADCQGFPLSGCAGDIYCGGWPSELWRPEVLAAYQACQRSCPADPEACPRAAFAAAGAPRAIDSQYSDACRAKEVECSLPNNVCGEESLYVESAVANALPCVSQTECFRIDSCVDQAFGRARSE